MVEKHSKMRNPVRLTAQWLFALNAVIWLAIGAATLLRQSGRGSSVGIWVLAVLIAGNAAAMAVCAWGLGQRGKLFIYLALLVLAVNILLTFTDQFGLLDLLTLLLDLVILALVLVLFYSKRTG